LGLSATIHFLNRARIEDYPTPTRHRDRTATVLMGRFDPDIAGAGLRLA